MFISAVIAGSFLPFSSEVVMMGLIGAGLKPVPLLIYATVGNWAGSMFNCYVGHLGKMEWIERYLHVDKAKLDRAQRFMGTRGAWMGFFAFLPVIGTAICIALGLMRANLPISAFSIFLGKIFRYLLIAWGSLMLF
jgi:membrane protein YqaA with SNARE-associated domain